MDKYKRQAVLIFLALTITFSSLAVARLGQPYYCSQSQKYPELHRDERGIPLTYIKRSVQGTGCTPKDMNDYPLTFEKQYHSVQYTIFIFDFIFWYGILTVLRVIFKKSDKSK